MIDNWTKWICTCVYINVYIYMLWNTKSFFHDANMTSDMYTCLARWVHIFNYIVANHNSSIIGCLVPCNFHMSLFPTCNRSNQERQSTRCLPPGTHARLHVVPLKTYLNYKIMISYPKFVTNPTKNWHRSSMFQCHLACHQSKFTKIHTSIFQRTAYLNPKRWLYFGTPKFHLSSIPTPLIQGRSFR